MASAVRRLLDELSWEGNARKYRDGGLGLENVITTEVFQALDFLPRQAFLGTVLAGVSGASLTALQAEIEQVVVDVLPGDLTHSDLDIRAQPDARIDSLGAPIPSPMPFMCTHECWCTPRSPRSPGHASNQPRVFDSRRTLIRTPFIAHQLQRSLPTA